MYHQEIIDYDNRFGFAKYCTAYWTFDPDRVGENFLFRFPNGMKVSVIRHSTWRYEDVSAGFSFGISYGFMHGLYELAAVPDDVCFGLSTPIGWLTAKEVHKHLSRIRNFKTNTPR